MKTINQIIKEIYDSYSFEEINNDKEELFNNIKTAIKEAYMIGAVHSGLDNQIYLHGCKYCKENSGIEAVRLVSLE